MLFSRFWIMVLALVGVGALAITLAASSAFNRQTDSAVEDQLRRDRIELEMLLRLEARSRIDAIGPLAGQPEIIAGLREASGRAQVEPSAKLVEKLRSLNQSLNELAGDVVLLTDDRGRVLGGIGIRAIPADSNLSEVPLVRDALAGYVRDDVWVLGDDAYRMAARPVLDGDAYVGSIIHGKKIDDRLAQKVAERLDGATVAFFFGDRAIARQMPSVQGAIRVDELAATLKSARQDEKFKSGNRTDAVDIGGGRGIFSPFTGSGGALALAYGVARPRTHIASFGVFDQLTDSDQLSGKTWAALAGVGLLAFAIGMLFIWLERDRPLLKLIEGTKHIATKLSEGERLVAGSFRGKHRRVAMAINDTIDAAARMGGASGGRRAAKLDEILGETPEDALEPSSFFGFSARKDPTGKNKNKRPTKDADEDAQTMSASALELKTNGSGGGRPPTPTGTRLGGKANAPPIPKPPAPKGVKPISASSLSDEPDEPATMVAQVPDELRERSSTKGKALPSTPPEESHFREVFDRFVVTKKQCGESTDGVTFDRFVLTLRKNEQSILEKTGVSRVHFTVYVKDGKAALKATPVK